jgi:hypothetical protein
LINSIFTSLVLVLGLIVELIFAFAGPRASCDPFTLHYKAYDYFGG